MIQCSFLKCDVYESSDSLACGLYRKVVSVLLQSASKIPRHNRAYHFSDPRIAHITSVETVVYLFVCLSLVHFY